MEKGKCVTPGCYCFGRYCRIPGHMVYNKKEDDKKNVVRKLSLKQFFDEMLQKAPARCMETGKKLLAPKVNPRCIVMHILPKRKLNDGGVPSMNVDERNVLFVNEPIHTAADTKGEEYVKQMKLFPVMKERVADMWPEIPYEERKNIPDYLKPNSK